jgi:hypothetical protein
MEVSAAIPCQDSLRITIVRCFMTFPVTNRTDQHRPTTNPRLKPFY